MKILGGRGTDAVTLVHKLVGLAWLIAAAGALAIVVSAIPAGGAIDWALLAVFGRIGSAASVATLVLGLVYVIFTPWGLLGSRWLIVKWVLYLVAVSASGYAIRATREQEAGMVALLAGVQLLALSAAMGIGVYLERARHSGRLLRKHR